jgi:hypothetical protein
MALEDLDFVSVDLSECGPHLMPYLIELRLRRITFEGRLQDYLDCPKLKRLYLDKVKFYDQETDIEGDNYSPKISMPLSSSVSFSSIPELETLYVRNGKFDGKLTSYLQSCPLLQHMSAESCSIEEFIPSFEAAIADSQAFPSLKSLCIQNSRTTNPWPQQTFARYCVSQHPGLAVSSNDRQFGDT